VNVVHRLRLGAHFGESIGTFAHTQFFQEPSAATQAAEADGAGAAVAKCRSTHVADRNPAAMTATNVAEPVASSVRVIGPLRG
jgi:hypothetical protein